MRFLCEALRHRFRTLNRACDATRPATLVSDSLSDAKVGFGADARHNDQIDARRKLRTDQAERLAQETLPAIANDGPADLSRDRKPEPRMRQPVWMAVDDNRRIGGAGAASKRPLKIAGSPYSMRVAEIARP